MTVKTVNVMRRNGDFTGEIVFAKNTAPRIAVSIQHQYWGIVAWWFPLPIRKTHTVKKIAVRRNNRWEVQDDFDNMFDDGLIERLCVDILVAANEQYDERYDHLDLDIDPIGNQPLFTSTDIVNEFDTDVDTNVSPMVGLDGVGEDYSREDFEPQAEETPPSTFTPDPTPEPPSSSDWGSSSDSGDDFGGDD